MSLRLFMGTKIIGHSEENRYIWFVFIVCFEPGECSLDLELSFYAVRASLPDHKSYEVHIKRHFNFRNSFLHTKQYSC